MARVDSISKEMLKEMKKAGCKKIQFGLESGSEKVLEMMNKHANLKQAETAVKMVNEAGIKA